MATSRWHSIGGGRLELDEQYCYTGTKVQIVPYSSHRFGLLLINLHDTPQTDKEVSRRYGSVSSDKSWKTANGAKDTGLAIARRIDFLEAAGIKFKPEE